MSAGQTKLLGRWLLNFQEDHPQGRALDYTIGEHMITTNQNRRRADRVIWAGLGRMPNVRRERPTIVVEFVSEGRRNRTREWSLNKLFGIVDKLEQAMREDQTDE